MPQLLPRRGLRRVAPIYYKYTRSLYLASQGTWYSSTTYQILVQEWLALLARPKSGSRAAGLALALALIPQLRAKITETADTSIYGRAGWSTCPCVTVLVLVQLSCATTGAEPAS